MGDPLDDAMGRYAAGEDAAFGALYGLLAPRIFGFCMRLARQRAEAEEVFQETFLKLHRARGTYISGSTAIHWTFAIARSVYLDRLRYRRRRPEAPGETEDASTAYPSDAGESASPEAHAQAKELIIVIDRVLQRLPENQRAAYVLVKEEGLSVADAAAVLGTTVMAVKLRTHRAYDAIRAGIRRAEGEDGAKGGAP